jgi:tetratricopeptide (TPR) repeat protein
MRHPSRLAAGVLAACITLAVLTHLVRDRNPASGPSRTETSPPTLGRDPSIDPAPPRSRSDELERLIRVFEEQVRTAPSATGFAFLGRLELERARLTGDGSSYVRAATALEEAVTRAPTDVEARTLLATVRFTTHDFPGAFEIADRLVSSGGGPSALAVRGDAAIELGRYREAAEDYRLLAAELPRSAGAHVRLARLAFLDGDVGEAVREARVAEELATRDGSFGATLSWYAAFRGRLALDRGRYGEAALHYRRAVRAAPDHHVAVAGLAAARVAQGRSTEAIALFRRAIRMVPEPSYVGALGDLYAAAGRRRLAERRYRTVEAIGALAGTGPPVYDRQRAMFLADHDLRLPEALRLVRAELSTRRDVYGWDALAWVMLKLGRPDEARVASERALALGTPDARLWYHAGMISAALGEDERAREELTRALTLSPRFDLLQAERARRRLAALGGDP